MYHTVQSVILMFETLISIRIVRHTPPRLVNLLIALFKMSTPKIKNNEYTILLLCFSQECLQMPIDYFYG